MKLVGARLGDEGDDAAAGLAELGFEPVGIDGELGDRFDRRREVGGLARRRRSGWYSPAVRRAWRPRLPAWPPPRDSALPLPFDSGAIETRSKGLRMAPPTTSGSSSTILFCTAVETLAFSVCSCAAAARHLDGFADVPISSLASMRAVLPAVSVTPSSMKRLNPAAAITI